MAQLYTVGPAHIFIGLPVGGGVNNQTILYLGTCEDAPRVNLRPAYEGAFNAITGSKIPMDQSFQGEEAFIGLDLTRYNQAVADAIQQRTVASAAPGGSPGAFVPGDYGTLGITENAVMSLWMTFPYALKAAMAAQRPGYHFLAAFPIGPDDLGPLSTRTRKLHLMWHAIPEYDPVSGNLTLYDFNTAGLPATD